mgnify:CR=1 FL=1
MTQRLALINKGDRITPATYHFGRNERLNIHPNNYADLTDANTGACIRTFDWDFVRNMGYSPAKLLAGNEIDQFIDNSHRSALTAGKSYVNHIIGGALIGLAIAAIGNVTGCTDLVIDKAEQDISTSTIQPRAAQSEISLAHFQAQNAYANEKLRAMNLYAAGGEK